MISLYESYVVEVGFEQATPGSAIRRATDLAMEHNSFLDNLCMCVRMYVPASVCVIHGTLPVRGRLVQMSADNIRVF